MGLYGGVFDVRIFFQSTEKLRLMLTTTFFLTQNGITKLKKLLEGNNDEQQFEADHYMQLYT